MSTAADTWIVYDGECPFCRNYVALIKLRKSIGPVRIINARDGGREVEQLKAAGLDLDEGMALHYGGHLYHGDACIHMLAMLTESTGIFNRLNVWMFKSSARAKFFYPIMRCGRNLTLKLLGRKKLNGQRF